MKFLTQRWRHSAVILSVGAFFLIVAFLPLIFPALDIVASYPKDTLKTLMVFSSPELWILFGNSLSLCISVVLTSLIIGIPMGFLLGRTNVVFRKFILFAYCFPMFLTPFLLALGWFYIFGQQGYLGDENTAKILFSNWGYIAILGLTFSPVITVLVALGLCNIDPRLEDAARVLASPFYVAKHILLPAILPSVYLGTILVFALSFSELGVPMFLRIDVYPTAVLSKLGGIDYNPAEAFLLALPLFFMAFLMVAAERILLRKKSLNIFGIKQQNKKQLPLEKGQLPISIVCWAITLFSLFPIAALILKASLGNSVGNGFLQAANWIDNSLLNSLLATIVAATLIVAIGAFLGHAKARKLAGSNLFDLAGVFAFVTPAILLGVGMIALWNRPACGYIYNGIGIIIIGYIARYGIIGIRTIAVSISQSPISFEQSAAASGAGYLKRLIFIVLPMHRQTLVVAWLLAAVFCLRDLETAVLYYPPDWQPLTVKIFTLEANGSEPLIAGLAVIQVAITMLLLIFGVFILTKRLKK